MKKNSIYVMLAVMLLAFNATAMWSQAVGQRATGVVTDNGKPAAGLQVILTNEDNGRSYKTKTDKNGGFDLIGIGIGTNYKLELFSTTGESVFKRGKIQITGEGGAVNEYKIDISDASKTNLGMTNEVGTKPSGGAAAGGQPKYTKEQLDAMKAQNAKAQSQNALISQAVNAINAKQWQEAIPPLQQLIAADPGRYEF